MKWLGLAAFGCQAVEIIGSDVPAVEGPTREVVERVSLEGTRLCMLEDATDDDLPRVRG